MQMYQPLADFLDDRKGDEWDASFAEIERVIGRPLPVSAGKYPAWWANQADGHSQTAGWRSVGWKTTAVDLPHRRVRFVRERPADNRNTPALATSSVPLDLLWARARTLTGIGNRDAILRLALEGLIARISTARLAGLGGSMPDFATPPRGRR